MPGPQPSARTRAPAGKAASRNSAWKSPYARVRRKRASMVASETACTLRYVSATAATNSSGGSAAPTRRMVCSSNSSVGMAGSQLREHGHHAAARFAGRHVQLHLHQPPAALPVERRILQVRVNVLGQLLARARDARRPQLHDRPQVLVVVVIVT